MAKKIIPSISEMTSWSIDELQDMIDKAIFLRDCKTWELTERDRDNIKNQIESLMKIEFANGNA